MFTDGISEAMNQKSELYGIDRLRQLIGDTVGNAEVVGRTVLQDVKQYVGRNPQSDCSIYC